MGWVKIHRKIFDDSVYFSEPFSRGQAWIDLIILANHANGFFFIRGIKIDVLRGQVGYGLDVLAERWKWSRGKVERFMKILEKDQKITRQKNNITTLISILNYDKYQDNDKADDNANSKADGQQTVKQMDTNKNDKNVNKEKELKPITDISGNSVSPKKILAFINRITSKNYQSISKQTIRQLTACFKLYSNIDLEIAIRNAAHDEFHRKNKHKHLTFLYITRSDQFEKWLQSGPVTKENISIYREQDNIKPEIATQLQNLLP